MGEGRTEPHNADRAATEPTGQTTERRATVGEAAGELGITAEAVRSRIKRGTLRSTKEGSTVYVLLEGGHHHGDRTATEHDRAHARTSPEQDQTSDRAALVDVLRDQVEYLREQLGEEREARRRADHIIAGLSESNASLAGRVRELTAAETNQDAPETAAEASESAESQPDTVGPQTGSQEPETARRPWWLRWLGG